MSEELRIQNSEFRKGNGVILSRRVNTVNLDSSTGKAIQEVAMKIDIRERTFAFSCDIVRFHRLLVRRGGEGRVLARQLLRSGTSIGANMEEANAGHSRADFLSKTRIALKEARETLYWLRLLVASECIDRSQAAHLLTEADELVAILTSIVKRTTDNSLQIRDSPSDEFSIEDFLNSEF